MLPGMCAEIRFHWRQMSYELLLRQREQRLQQALRDFDMGENSSDDSGDEVVDISYDSGSSDSEYEKVD